MSANRLTEEYIKTEAIAFLMEQYRPYAHNKKIADKTEFLTINRTRADGFLLYENAPEEIRVISLEAKSANTLRNLRSKWDKEKLINWNRAASELVLILFACLTYPFLKGKVVYDPTLIIAVVLVLLAIRHFTLPSIKRLFATLLRTTSVFEQAALYPGNEVWIAIGSDTFKRNKVERLGEFVKLCEQKKFGLLEISAFGHPPKILVYPTFRVPQSAEDFLHFYKKGQELRPQVSGSHWNFLRQFRRSPAERSFHQKHLILSSFVTIGLFYLLLMDIGPLELPSNQKLAPIAENSILPTPSFTPKPLPAPPVEFVEPVANTFTCSLPFKKKGKRFILKDKIVPTLQDAEARATALLNAGLQEVNYFWIPCTDYSPNTAAWCVYAYSDRSDLGKIANSERRYKRILKAAGLDGSEVDVWEVGAR